mmetsp:Transcript_1429/g.3447  ORF Transcript_1429/g.3447 Transcript_1429/m.3447 type:complete len:211 (-) Transcript_1429:78-710(-)
MSRRIASISHPSPTKQSRHTTRPVPRQPLQATLRPPMAVYPPVPSQLGQLTCRLPPQQSQPVARTRRRPMAPGSSAINFLAASPRLGASLPVRMPPSTCLIALAARPSGEAVRPPTDCEPGDALLLDAFSASWGWFRRVSEAVLPGRRTEHDIGTLLAVQVSGKAVSSSEGQATPRHRGILSTACTCGFALWMITQPIADRHKRTAWGSA